jgi:hypothetical protein
MSQITTSHWSRRTPLRLASVFQTRIHTRKNTSSAPSCTSPALRTLPRRKPRNRVLQNSNPESPPFQCSYYYYDKEGRRRAALRAAPPPAHPHCQTHRNSTAEPTSCWLEASVQLHLTRWRESQVVLAPLAGIRRRVHVPLPLIRHACDNRQNRVLERLAQARPRFDDKPQIRGQVRFLGGY